MDTLPVLASVDLGSNSFRLQICQNQNGQPQVIENIKHMVRFAAGLDEHKNLDEASQERALACLAQFGERLRGFDPEQVRTVATNTFRVAKNIADFLPRAEAALGYPIEIIAGREEARLIYTGVVHTFPANGRKMLVIDIGGGSTEFITGHDLQPTQLASLAMGCVTYSLRFFQGKITAKDFQLAINAARAEIQRIGKAYKREGWDISIGTSGTAKALFQVIEANGLGECITLKAMNELKARIIEAGSTKKAGLLGLKPERVEVLAGGLAVMIAAFEELEIAEMMFTEAALRDGVFYEQIGRSLNEDMRNQTALHFQKRYHASAKQAERVAQTAIRFLNSLAQTALVQELNYWTDYVRWAAMLHEIGIDIAHTAYHKHTSYILAQADMPGFSRQEQELLSLLTLGQRGDLRKMQTIADDKTMLWNALLALRLGVLFCRARVEVELPHNTVLYRLEQGDFRLRISKNWLERNPLTYAALQFEKDQWQKIGKNFHIEEL